MGADKLVPKVLSVLVSFSITIAGSQISALAKSDNSPLSEVEQRLFFKTYTEDTNDARLERLEKRVFGTIMTGSFDERLSRVSGASQPQVNPDGSMTGNVPPPDSGTTSNTNTPPAKSQAQIDQEEREAAAERARISAQAAKEEQASQTMSQGVELWRSKKGPEALEKFEQVIRMQPNNADAYYSAGIIYESTGNLKAALSSYQQASSIQGGNKDYSDAVSAVQKKMSVAANISPKQAEINRLTEQANAAYKRQEFLSALDLYKQLDFVNPNQALVKYNIGTLYLQIKDPFTALQYYKSAATLNPKEQKYVAAYQKLQAGVNKEEAQQEAVNSQWTNAGYDLAHIGENPPAGNNQNQGASQPPPPNNQGNFKRPVLNMGQQASQAKQNGGMQQPQQQQSMPMQNQMSGATNPVQTANMAPPQGFLPTAAPQFPPTGTGNSNNSNSSAKNSKSKSQPSKPKQQQQQMPMQMQQQMQQMQMQPMPQQMQQPVQQQNYNNQGVDPAAAREMQAVLQQNMAAGNIPGNFGGQQQQQQPPSNPPQNMPVNNYKPNFTPSPGNPSANNAPPPTQNSNKNANVPLNNKFGFAPPPPDAAATYGIIAGASKEGIRATEVGIGSRASRAGLRKGDLIRAIDGTVLRSVQQLNDALTKKNGASVQLYVQRNSQMATLTL